MIHFRNKEEGIGIDDVIQANINQIEDDGDYRSEDVTSMISNLSALYDCKIKSNRTGLTKDAILGTLTTIGSIVTILIFERNNTIGTKAFSFIPRMKN